MQPDRGHVAVQRPCRRSPKWTGSPLGGSVVVSFLQRRFRGV